MTDAEFMARVAADAAIERVVQLESRLAQLEADMKALYDALLEAAEIIRRRDQVALEEHAAVLDLLARADAALAAAERA